MPRGRQKNLDAKIAASEEKIEKLTEAFNKAKKALQEEKENLNALKAEQKNKEQQAIIDAFNASGKSIEEIKEMLGVE